MWRTHAPTYNKGQKKKKTLHMLTHGEMWGCGMTSLMISINDKIRDIRKRNVTIRSEIWTTNIHSLWFWDIREWVTLWGLISQSLGCTSWQSPPCWWGSFFSSTLGSASVGGGFWAQSVEIQVFPTLNQLHVDSFQFYSINPRIVMWKSSKLISNFRFPP